MEERRCACVCCMLSSQSEEGFFPCFSVKLDTSLGGCAFLTLAVLNTVPFSHAEKVLFVNVLLPQQANTG